MSEHTSSPAATVGGAGGGGVNPTNEVTSMLREIAMGQRELFARMDRLESAFLETQSHQLNNRSGGVGAATASTTQPGGSTAHPTMTHVARGGPEATGSIHRVGGGSAYTRTDSFGMESSPTSLGGPTGGGARGGGGMGTRARTFETSVLHQQDAGAVPEGSLRLTHKSYYRRRRTVDGPLPPPTSSLVLGGTPSSPLLAQNLPNSAERSFFAPFGDELLSEATQDSRQLHDAPDDEPHSSADAHSPTAGIRTAGEMSPASGSSVNLPTPSNPTVNENDSFEQSTHAKVEAAKEGGGAGSAAHPATVAESSPTVPPHDASEKQSPLHSGGGGTTQPLAVRTGGGSRAHWRAVRRHLIPQVPSLNTASDTTTTPMASPTTYPITANDTLDAPLLRQQSAAKISAQQSQGLFPSREPTNVWQDAPISPAGKLLLGRSGMADGSPTTSGEFPIGGLSSAADHPAALLRDGTVDDFASLDPSSPAHATGPDAGTQDSQGAMAIFSRIRKGETINVEGSLVSTMDVLFLIIGVLTCIFVIYVWHPESSPDTTKTPQLWLVLWIAFAEVFAACWVALRFFIRNRKGEWDVVDDGPSVKKHYKTTWFAFDLIYTLPLEFIFIGWANNVFSLLLFRHFLRYIRGMSLGSSVNPFLASRSWFRFVFFCVSLVLIAHCLTAIFWSVAAQAAREQMGTNPAPSQRVMTNVTYVDALYWAAATITSTGYGDVPTPKQNERIYAVFCMFLGAVTLSTFTAFSTKFWTAENVIKHEQNANKERMHGMLQHYQVPWSVQKDVMHYYRTVINSHSERQFTQLTEDLPEHLQDTLSVYFNVHLLRQVPFFAQLPDRSVIEQLAPRMHREFYAPHEEIFRQGDEGSSLYFVVNGVVEIVKISDVVENGVRDELVVATLHRGRMFGEGALLQDQNRRSASAIAKIAAELIVLGRDDFLEVMNEHEALKVDQINNIAPQRRVSMTEDQLVIPLAFRNQEDAN